MFGLTKFAGHGIDEPRCPAAAGADGADDADGAVRWRRWLLRGGDEEAMVALAAAVALAARCCGRGGRGRLGFTGYA